MKAPHHQTRRPPASWMCYSPTLRLRISALSRRNWNRFFGARAPSETFGISLSRRASRGGHPLESLVKLASELGLVNGGINAHYNLSAQRASSGSRHSIKERKAQNQWLMEPKSVLSSVAVALESQYRGRPSQPTTHRRVSSFAAEIAVHDMTIMHPTPREKTFDVVLELEKYILAAAGGAHAGSRPTVQWAADASPAMLIIIRALNAIITIGRWIIIMKLCECLVYTAMSEGSYPIYGSTETCCSLCVTTTNVTVVTICPHSHHSNCRPPRKSFPTHVTFPTVAVGIRRQTSHLVSRVFSLLTRYTTGASARFEVVLSPKIKRLPIQSLATSSARLPRQRFLNIDQICRNVYSGHFGGPLLGGNYVVYLFLHRFTQEMKMVKTRRVQWQAPENRHLKMAITHRQKYVVET
ncbi:hypothetical protein VP01_1812g1 [Puccinia sorghi]|uniref:Uncharacterized protein n=1 Tax=Puccinia sorghi TaxID=27349 RepID=A0A0L6VG00_9BASI|nr:hypothetical protein VP01_1812g1 [Puccinia sorghi]